MDIHHEAYKFVNVSTGKQFSLLLGGVYAVDVIGSNYGTVKIQKLGPDSSTLIDLKAPFDNAGAEQDDVIGTFAANGSKNLMLSPGVYEIVIASATAVSVTIARCSTE